MWLPEAHAFGGLLASVVGPRSDRLPICQFFKAGQAGWGASLWNGTFPYGEEGQAN